MKSMKLGYRPDTFYTAEAVRSVSSEISSDLIIQVKSTRYLLHKFPMLSRCLKLQSMISSEGPATSKHQVIHLHDFPCDAETFELCAKFCYGITITINAHNIVALRCAAEYLEMTQEFDESRNLIQKLELFLNSCVFNSWRESLITLENTKVLPLWSENLGITNRCIQAISRGINAGSGNEQMGFPKRQKDEILCNGGSKIENSKWWAEEISDLCVELYMRTMEAIKSSNGNIPSRIIGDALRIYASKWLPGFRQEIDCKNRRALNAGLDSGSDTRCSKHRVVLESLVSLLPREKDSVPCDFLLRLLKMTNILNVSASLKTELAIKVATQLDEATVRDLLIPLSDKSGILYDVDIVITMVKEFLSSQTPNIVNSPRSTKTIHETAETSSSISRLKVAKLVDAYLQEIARDVNLPLSEFISLAEMIPQSLRLDHDDIYKAIDIYLQNHVDIEKGERKMLCRVLDCKKLSLDTSSHAVQNELLPLRVIVKILFFEKARASMAAVNAVRDSETAVSSRSRRSPTMGREIREEDERTETDLNHDRPFQSTPSRFKPFYMIQRRPKKIIQKWFSISRSLSQRN